MIRLDQVEDKQNETFILTYVHTYVWMMCCILWKRRWGRLHMYRALCIQIHYKDDL